MRSKTDLLVLPPLAFSSYLPAAAPVVWAHATDFDGINHELMPILKMTAPATVRGLDPERIVLGERVCRSWLLLGGVLPVDYDDITLTELEPGRRFLEQSTMLSSRRWQHERSIRPINGDSCTVTDRISLVARVPGTGPALRYLVRLLFAHRHRRLVRRFSV